MKKLLLTIFLLLHVATLTFAKILKVGENEVYNQIKKALLAASNGDTVMVKKGWYKEGNILIDKPIHLIGEGEPILDGEKKYEVVSIRANNVLIKGFIIKNSTYNSLNDPAGISIYDSKHVHIINNYLYNNFFGVHMEHSHNCIIKNNTIVATAQLEQEIGNGIHCWKSDSVQIVGNKISGHRDGIYFEFVTNSVIWRNISFNNIRYGLHFMFSHNDAYFTNIFRNNGAGVAVMFTKNVVMMNNTFEKNWGDASYGLLLKEISDCNLEGNKFLSNTSGIFMDGTNRIKLIKNIFKSNGWGIQIQANCMDNIIEHNNFLGNTFDVSTNGSLTLNTFNQNYWDKYEGYDLDKNTIGDIHYRPLSLYAVIIEINPPAILLYRSFIVTLLDNSERILPTLTPTNFIDLNPLMRPLPL